jgi:hypothetical protein
MEGVESNFIELQKKIQVASIFGNIKTFLENQFFLQFSCMNLKDSYKITNIYLEAR